MEQDRHCSDEHEEGEIIDDFEDISDYSIHSTSYSGKSVSNQDLLQDVSLSSISDVEPNALIYLDTYSTSTKKHAKRKRKPIHCHRKKRHKSNGFYARRNRFVRKYVSPSPYTSESSDLEIDPKTHKQLQDAIRIERSHIHHNSLRTRLRAMLQNDDLQNKSEDEDALRTLALLSNAKQDIVEDEEGKQEDKKINGEESADDKDEELIELRLAALKSAVLRKAPEIRKRKYKLQPKRDSTNPCEVNKENDVNQENNMKDDNENCNDEKGTETPDTKVEATSTGVSAEISKSVSLEEDIDIMRAKLLASMSKKVVAEEARMSLAKETKMKMIARAPEKRAFLKQQMKVKPLIINLNDTDSDTDVTVKQGHQNPDDNHLVSSVSEFLRKQRAAVEAKHKTEAVTKTALDKSVVKLLPKSQQKEYHLLQQKLLLARRKRKAAQKTKENNENLTRRSPKKTTANEEGVQQATQPKPSGLQKTLEDLQINKNGRLQMKGKYKALAPLLLKVNQASIDRKRCELELKTLLDSLQKAKDKLALSHQNYSNLVKRLTIQKNAIDKRANTMHNLNVVNNAVPVINNTSTPVKPNIEEAPCDISSIRDNSHDHAKESIVDTNIEQNERKDDTLPHIDKIEGVAQCDNDENAMLQYVSPLDIKNRDAVEDPLTSFCPYDLFGICKDPECKFNHCSKT